jgi:negative regulator of sigma E activity
MNAPRLLLVAVLSLLAPSCGPGSSTPTSGGAASSGFGGAAAAVAAKHAAFAAVRRYTSFSGVAPASYTERFVRAEDGRTKVELLELNGKPLASLTTQEEIDAFLTLQTLLAGGAGKFVAAGRDFEVREVDPFLQNYTYTILNPSASVAGRPCAIFEIRPKQIDRPSYLAWIDSEFFTTLKYVERLPSGAVAAEMECHDVDFAFNAKNEVFPASAASKPIEVSTVAWSNLVPFRVYEPAYLPAGFALASVKFATIAARPVLTWTYSDGVQELFVAQYAELGTPEIEPPPSYPANAPVHVRVNVLGAVVSTLFVIDGTQIHVKGKVEPEELMSLVESLGPVSG